MVSNFLLLLSRLNSSSFFLKQEQKLSSSGILFKVAIYFEYSKMEERYWTDEHLLEQIKTKVFLIAKILYSEYELLFMFDNAIGNAIYAKNVL